MHQVQYPTKTITVKIECFDDSIDAPYLAWIEGDEYRGIVVQGKSFDDCLKELSISIKVLEQYRKNTKNEPPRNP